MSVDGEGKDVSHGLVDDAETVAEARGDGGHGPGNLWAAVVASDPVYGTTVRDSSEKNKRVMS